MRIAVIGAGPSGLPAIKSALESGFEVVCFEKSNDLGGLWRFKPNPCPGEGTVMKSTVINTSKEMTAYSDFVPSTDMANFMHNSQLLEYFRQYAAEFGLTDYIRFHHEVLSIERADDFKLSHKWKVSYYDASTNNSAIELFDGVLVCTGHHTQEYWPEPFPGQKEFKGKVMHAHDYKDSKGFEDKTVVVVGIGNSGADIAVELSKISKKVYLSTRSGAWVMNRVWDKGEPTDLVYLNRFMFTLKKIAPWRLQNWMIERKVNSRFDHGRFGLRPNHRALAAHVTINDELPNRIISGTVVIKGNIYHFTENGIVFDDDFEVPDVDVVIFATGYSFGFSLVEKGELIKVKENRCDLYLNMYPPELADTNNLAVIGLIQPTGSIMPISEMQCRLFMEVLAGRTKLPHVDKMYANIKRKREVMDREFVKSRRHTIQVYYVEYMEELAKLMGCSPKILRRFLTDPKFAWVLFFNGLVPYQYRLDGPHQWEDAREAILGVEERVFEATRTRRTTATLQSRPSINYLWRILKG